MPNAADPFYAGNELILADLFNMFKMQEKEHEVQAREQAASEWRSKCDAKDAELVKYKREIESLREHLSSLQEDLLSSKQQLSQSQPRLFQLEPEVRQLHQAKAEWEAERNLLQRELRELRNLRDQLDQLHDDLKETPLDDESEQVVLKACIGRL